MIKSYFLKNEKNDASRTFREFFENDFNKRYFWALHAFVAIYQIRVKDTEEADGSVNEIFENCSEIMNSINARIAILRKFKDNNENSEQVTGFKKDIKHMYIIARIAILRKFKDNNENSEQVTGFKKDIKHMYILALDYVR
ncbi:hypothetical protein QE152_g40 [Popillia japonica]|uniref:Uncharacterized protein n=1 Tax=Popillia japonica TaxID=7064 RepID=A0AAW1NDV5_POPJA